MIKHLITLACLALALVCYGVGFVVPGIALIVVGVIAEAAFWFRIVKGVQEEEAG